MAGIGFVLRRVVAEETYSSVFKGYLAAAIISSGPWFLAVFTLALLGVVSSSFLPAEARVLFFSSIVYSFSFSLIVTGVLQMPANRLVADLLYVGKLERITPALVTLLLVVLPIMTAIMTAVFAASGVSLPHAFTVGILFASVSGIWLTMIFLSAAKRYGAIVWAFFFGYVMSFTGTFILGHLYGPAGAAAGFTLGQSVTLILLWVRVVVEFGQPTFLDLTVFKYLARFPSLVLIGLLYNLAVWIDKIMFWFSGGDGAVQVQGVIHIFPQYDTATFLAFLSAAPAMALFLTQVETGFYGEYRAFYDSLINKASLSDIQKKKKAMGQAMVSSYWSLLRLQFLIVVLGLAFAPAILNALGLPQSPLFMLRVGIVSVGLHVFLSITVLLLLYFDMRGSVVLVLGAFLATNVIATFLTLQGGYQWYGYGFLVAESVGTAMAIAALVNRFRRLEFLTFSRQPITDLERSRAELPFKERGAIVVAKGVKVAAPTPLVEQAATPPPTEIPQSTPVPATLSFPATAAFTVRASLDNVSAVRQWAEARLKEWRVPSEASGDLMLALTEVCTNIVRHGYGLRGAGEIKINMTREDGAVRVVTEDSAPVFIPAAIAAPEPGALSEGGYGLYLIRATTDDVKYEALGENGNRITLVKRDKRP